MRGRALERHGAHRDALAALAGEFPLAVGGAAVSRVDLGQAVLPLRGAPVEGADRLTRLARGLAGRSLERRP